MKALKLWNGRGHGKYNRHTFYIAAYSGKQAIEIVNKALGYQVMTVSELRNYYNKGMWGNRMDHITPTEPCLYVAERFSKIATRLI